MDHYPPTDPDYEPDPFPWLVIAVPAVALAVVLATYLLGVVS